ncbi:putative cytochrome P450 [Medicago truncatula]|uniref:Putative cytochrome P450 n=1 Tax=Medicago truncatula TaxID=3880 RepID=A0A396HN49_MEDTR|nr:putative cytochrome P450 [Medicago truncatula]
MFMIQCIGGFAAILFVIYIYYWRHNGGEIMMNWPIVGMLLSVLRHLSNFNNHVTLVLKGHEGMFRFEGPWFTNTSFIATADPINVNHIASKNFGNYGRGSINFQEIFEFFGGGIVNSDSHVWKEKRTMFHSILKRKSFKNLFQQTSQKKLEKFLLPFIQF